MTEKAIDSHAMKPPGSELLIILCSEQTCARDSSSDVPINFFPETPVRSRIESYPNGWQLSDWPICSGADEFSRTKHHQRVTVVTFRNVSPNAVGKVSPSCCPVQDVALAFFFPVSAKLPYHALTPGLRRSCRFAGKSCIMAPSMESK